jgi:hypothetical protein
VKREHVRVGGMMVDECGVESGHAVRKHKHKQAPRGRVLVSSCFLSSVAGHMLCNLDPTFFGAMNPHQNSVNTCHCQ